MALHEDVTAARAWSEDAVIGQIWRSHRRRMLDISFRMLADLGDAEDVVQEAFVRLSRIDPSTLEDVEGWLVVVTGRLCLDRLRTRRRRPTEALDPRADPFDSAAVDPADRVTLGDQVTLAMHTVLERLSPAERTVFVLHDVFQYSFADVATILGKSAAASRQLASRARRTLRAEHESSRFDVEPAQRRELSERFIAACEGGDIRSLLELLDPSVEGAGDIAPEVVCGAENVASGILRYLGPPASPTLLHLPVGDRIGIVAMHARSVLAIVLLTVDNGRVVHVDALAGDRPCRAVSHMLRHSG